VNDRLNLGLQEHELRVVFDDVDKDGSGTIDVREFIRSMRSEDYDKNFDPLLARVVVVGVGVKVVRCWLWCFVCVLRVWCVCVCLRMCACVSVRVRVLADASTCRCAVQSAPLANRSQPLICHAARRPYHAHVSSHGLLFASHHATLQVGRQRLMGSLGKLAVSDVTDAATALGASRVRRCRVGAEDCCSR
jgi:hypothetical protein